MLELVGGGFVINMATQSSLLIDRGNMSRNSTRGDEQN